MTSKAKNIIEPVTRIRNTLKNNNENSNNSHELIVTEDAKTLLCELSVLLSWANENNKLPSGSIPIRVEESYNDNVLQYIIIVANEKKIVKTSCYNTDTLFSLKMLIEEQLPKQACLYIAPNWTLMYGRLYYTKH